MTGAGARGPAKGAGGVAIPVSIQHSATALARPGRREPAHVHRFTNVCRPQFYRRRLPRATLPAAALPRRRRRAGGYTLWPTAMTEQTEDVPRVLDTRGEQPFAATYAAVLVVEALVLAALWIFSRHFSG